MHANLLELQAWCGKKGLRFQWHALRVGSLMHAKGYAVLQVSAGQVGAGVVMIGSANATLPGLGLTAKGVPGNVELLHVSGEQSDISDYITTWNKLMSYSRDLSDAAKREDEYEFQYGLLASGVFLHDWKDSLNSKLGVRYSLTAEGRRNYSMNPELAELVHRFRQTIQASSPPSLAPQGGSRRRHASLVNHLIASVH